MPSLFMTSSRSAREWGEALAAGVAVAEIIPGHARRADAHVLDI